jgi:hypothetical protein
VPRAKRGEIWMADLGMAAKVRPVLVLSVAYEGQERQSSAMSSHDQLARYLVRSASRNSWHVERSIRHARSGLDTGDQTREASGTRRL